MSALFPFAFLPFAAMSSVGAGSHAVAPLRVYVGTYARGEERGIYLLEFRSDTGQLTYRGRVCETESPSFLAMHPNQPVLYAVNETVRPEGTVGAYRVDSEGGGLTLINEQPSGGATPCHLAVAPSGKHVAVANYSSGTVALFPILPGGGLGEASAVIQHEGHGVNPRRQEGPHAHSVNFDAAGRFVHAADLGVDKLFIYRYDPDHGTLTPGDPPFVAFAPGAGPRHLAFHPSGRYTYVVNELDNTVTAFRGTKCIGSVSTLPADFDGESHTAEIRVHPSGRFLYASNRGHDSIAVFSIDGADGKLTPLEHTPTGGKIPRNFNIDPTGRYLLAANQESSSIVVFRIDPESGLLNPTGRSVSVPSPVCILFAIVPGIFVNNRDGEGVHALD